MLFGTVAGVFGLDAFRVVFGLLLFGCVLRLTGGPPRTWWAWAAAGLVVALLVGLPSLTSLVGLG